MNPNWKRNWSSFIDSIASHVLHSDDLEPLLRKVSGQKVEWSGLLREVGIDDMAPNVYISFPSAKIVTRSGLTAVIDSVSLPVRENQKEKWLSLSIGDTVRFSAVVGREEGIFPPVSIKSYNTGETIITVRLSDGVVLERQ